MNAAELKELKTRAPDEYRAHLAAIEERRLGTSVSPEPEHKRSGLDAFSAYLREALSTGGITDGQASQLALIRRGAIYACATLRADMLARLPIRAYKLSGSSRGRKVDIRDPLKRLGFPAMARGVRLAEASTVTEVEGTDLARRLGRPNEDWTGRALVRMTEISLSLAGQSYWRLHGRGVNADRPPQGISYLKHTRMKPVKSDADETGSRIASWLMDDYTAQRKELKKGEVVWIRYPDPEDPDFGVLAPADVARLGAETYRDAMQANRDIFQRGLTAAGIVMPTRPNESTIDELTSDQQLELERDLNRKLTDPKLRRRLAVLGYRLDIQGVDSVSPKDAEFIALMDFAIEDAARTYRIPIEFVGGARRTYQNMEAAQKGIWQMALEPEACFIADELTVKFAPAFGDEVDFVAFDLSDVVALQDDEAEKWRREKEQMEAGVLQANEWRLEQGKDPLATAVALNVGQVTALVNTVTAVGKGDITHDQGKAIVSLGLAMGDDAADKIIGDAPVAPKDAPAPADTPTAQVYHPTDARIMAYGSDEHRAVMTRVADAQRPHETRITKVVRDLFTRQEKSVIDSLTAQSRTRAVSLDSLFSKARWVREFREKIRPELAKVANAAGSALLESLDIKDGLDIGAAPVVNFLRGRAQRFATEVNDTTWEKLKRTLEEGIASGEDTDALSSRVADVMDIRRGAESETIARTEVLGAYSGGSQLAAEQSDLDLEKTWLSALDSRTRDSHEAAHGQTVALDEDFEVGDCSGPGPGMTDCPEEDINCRCTVTYQEKNSERTRVGGVLINASIPAA